MKFKTGDKICGKSLPPTKGNIYTIWYKVEHGHTMRKFEIEITDNLFRKVDEIKGHPNTIIFK